MLSEWDWVRKELVLGVWLLGSADTGPERRVVRCKVCVECVRGHFHWATQNSHLPKPSGLYTPFGWAGLSQVREFVKLANPPAAGWVVVGNWQPYVGRNQRR